HARQGQRCLGLGHGVWSSRSADGEATGCGARRTRRTGSQIVMTRVTQLAAIAFGAMAALMLAGCGERPQVIDYKQGKYQGKPDEPPYAAAPFQRDKEN